MYKRSIVTFFISYLSYCTILFSAAYCLQHRSHDTSHHIAPIENENFTTKHHKHHNCRYICSNQFGDSDESENQDGEFNQTSSTGRETLTAILQNLNNLPGNPASLVGIVFDRTGGFRGIVRRISNLNDIIQGFPNSNEIIIISSLGRLRSNPFLQGFLRFGNRLYSDEQHILSGGLEQVSRRRQILQEWFQRLPGVTGIFSTPVGIIFNAFPAGIFREVFANLSSPSEIPSRFAILFQRLPSLAGIFLRPRELISYLNNFRNISPENSTALFFGPERGFLTLETLFGRILSQFNLNRSGNASSLFRIIPIFSNIIERLRENRINIDFPRINSTNNDNALVNSILNLGRILNNFSRSYGSRESYTFHELPQLTGQQAEALELFENLFSSYGSSNQLRISEIYNRFLHQLNNLYTIFSSGRAPSLSLNSTIFRSFLNTLHYFERPNRSSVNLNASEIVYRFSYELNNLYKILRSRNASGEFLNSSRWNLFLNFLRYFERAIGNGSSGQLNLNEIISRYPHELNNLYEIFRSGNTSAEFLNVLRNFGRIIENAVIQTENTRRPYTKYNSTNNIHIQESRLIKHHHISSTPKLTTKTPTHEEGNQPYGVGGSGTGGEGPGSIGIGGPGINERNARGHHKHLAHPGKKSEAGFHKKVHHKKE